MPVSDATETQVLGTKLYGKNLKRLRKDAGFRSQEEAARAMGMSTSAWRDREQGTTSWTLEECLVHARVLGLNIQRYYRELEREN